MNNQVDVSVWMTTYNQVNYICQAINSVLAQQVDFKYEIVIGDDASTDGTREVLLDYQKKFPDKVKLLLQPENKGIIQNSADTYDLCSGKYIAGLDGDDFWTDPLKLQKQFYFLETHSHVVLLANDVLEHFIDENGNVFKEKRMGENLVEGYLEPYDIFTLVIVINTLGIMFRNYQPGSFLSEHADSLVMPDISVWLYISQFGKIYFKKDVVAVYRQHHAGYSRKMNVHQIKRFLKQYQLFNKVFSDQGIKRRISEFSSFRYFELAVIYKTEKLYLNMLGALLQMLIYDPSLFFKYIILKKYNA